MSQRAAADAVAVLALVVGLTQAVRVSGRKGMSRWDAVRAGVTVTLVTAAIGLLGVAAFVSR